MLRFDIVSAVPELLTSPFDHSMMKRARDRGLLDVHVHDLRHYGLGKHQQIDDYQYGGGAGMVMMIEPIYRCFQELQASRPYDEVVFLAPDGERFNQSIANELSLKQNIILLCGHYKGVDERVRQHLITRELSIGDFVLSGAELAAAILVDAVGRLLPGVLNNEESALLDSFQDDLIAPPVFTRPAEYQGWKVPAVLLSGHEAKIEEWRYLQAVQRTRERRPDLLDKDEF
ncbi:MAG: tRNA (guanosine(37)-N1)-methyltransferase TrmD [Saprospiraceae bacterium]|nr:tRNA (guanosine(37)-N1)-methyltransferase TrmD [Saprospiraceae bacterium]